MSDREARWGLELDQQLGCQLPSLSFLPAQGIHPGRGLGGGGFSQSPGEGKPSSRNPELALDRSAMAVRSQTGGVCPGWGGEQWRESGGPSGAQTQGQQDSREGAGAWGSVPGG